jgi:hypothetical protein
MIIFVDLAITVESMPLHEVKEESDCAFFRHAKAKAILMS